MNLNQLMKLFRGMDVDQILRLFTNGRGKGNRGWTLLMVSGIAAAVGMMLRRNGNMMNSAKSVLFNENKKESNTASPFPMNQLLTTEFAEEFFRDRKDQSLNNHHER